MSTPPSFLDAAQGLLAGNGASPPSGPSPNGADVLNDVGEFLKTYIVFPTPHDLIAATLWVAHTHKLQAFESTPRLAFLSPEPGSGKTRALEAIEPLVPEAQHVLNATPAAVFRLINESRPVLLFDEVDTIFGKHGKDDGAEDLRGLLNAGHRQGATVPRCVGPTFKVEQFPVYAAIALAGLGNLPDTLLTRSVIVKMRRRAPNETVTPFRYRLATPVGNELRDRLAAWAASLPNELGTEGWEWPEMPEGVVDRPADVWESLLAIADAAGGEWPKVARAACVAITEATADTRHVSLGIRLLADLRTIFGDASGMHTADILLALFALEEAPWATLHGEGLNARGLANLLGEYDITSRDVWLDNVTRKGYQRSDLHESWVRYLPQEGARSARSASSQVTGQVPGQAPSPPSPPSPSAEEQEELFPSPPSAPSPPRPQGECRCGRPLITKTDHATSWCVFCRDDQARTTS